MLADPNRASGNLRIVETLDDGNLRVICDETWEHLTMAQDVYDELIDPEYITRQHYSRATYAKGCHGPLCRLRENLGKREQLVRRAQRNGEIYVPDPRMSTVRKQQMLQPVIDWHLDSRQMLRADRAAWGPNSPERR